MSEVARAMLPHLVVVAALLDAALVVALGLQAYTGVLVFTALFVVTLPALYALAVRFQPEPSTGRDTDGV